MLNCINYPAKTVTGRLLVLHEGLEPSNAVMK